MDSKDRLEVFAGGSDTTREGRSGSKGAEAVSAPPGQESCAA